MREASKGARATGAGSALGQLPARFIIKRELGQDRAGRSFEAFDHELGIVVTVRLLARSLTRTSAQQRCLEEDVAASRLLLHRNVGRVFDLVEIGDSLAIVSELVRGPTLRDRLARPESAPLSVDAAFALVRQLGAGLAAVHGVGLLHTDLSPACIAFDVDRAVILGLGIARVARRGPEGPVGSQEGLLVGDPAYLAPECAMDNASSRASDVYSLAALSYQLVYGHPPFGTASADGFVEVLDRLVHRAPEFPIGAPGGLAPSARDALARALAAGLAKDPADRPATVPAWMDLIGDAWRPAGPRPRRFVLAPVRPPNAVDAATGEQASDWLRQGERALERGQLDEAEALYEKVVTHASRDPHRWRQRALGLLGSAQVCKQRAAWPDMLARAERGLDIVDERREPVLAGRLLAAAAWVRGYLNGEPDGLRAARRAVTLLESAGNPAALADAYASLGACLEAAGDPAAQAAAHRRTAELGEQLGDPRITARGLLNLGEARRGVGDVEGAAAHAQRALELLADASAEPLRGLAHNNLSQSLVDSGHFDDALVHARCALAISEALGGLHYREESRIVEARALAARGDHDVAEQLLRLTADSARDQNISLLEGKARRTLGALLSRIGEDSDALDELDRAERLLARASAAERAHVRVERARAYRRAGHDAGADRELEDAMAELDAAGCSYTATELARTDRI